MKNKIFYGLVIVLTVVFLITSATVSYAFATGKKIIINLSNQSLKAYQNDQLIYNFAVSTGKAWWPTPTGVFKPQFKLLSDRMIGGNRQLGTYYDLSNVPHVVYFYQGYAIHGAYWHNNFGYPMSHGCVNVRPSEMSILYPWVDYATTIEISGVTPGG